MNFDVAKNIAERKYFENLLKKKSKDDLKMECLIAGKGFKELKNTFKLSIHQIDDLNLNQNLFGSSQQVYITREQINRLAIDVYTSANVAEDYEVPEHQFQESFISEIIKKTCDDAFKIVEFVKA